jgi:hypothetical protein
MRSTVCAFTLCITLISCGTVTTSAVFNQAGRAIGTVTMESDQEAVFKNTAGEERGRVRGNAVRDTGGKRLGTVQTVNGTLFLRNAEGRDIGTLESGNTCLGTGKESLGTISSNVPAGIAAAGCLVFFLGK